MNKKQNLKEERNKLEDEIERAENVWETKTSKEGEVFPGLNDNQKKAILRKIERVEEIEEELRSGVKSTKLKGRMFYPHEIKALIKESFIGVKELREKRLEVEYLQRKEKERKAKTGKIEGRKMTQVIKALDEGNWKLFMSRFSKIKQPEALSPKNQRKYKRIKAAIGKGLSLKEIVRIARETPGKHRTGVKEGRKRAPEWEALSEEEHEKAAKKETSKLQYQLRGIKKWDVLLSVLFFIPLFIFLLIAILKRAAKRENTTLFTTQDAQRRLGL